MRIITISLCALAFAASPALAANPPSGLLHIRPAGTTAQFNSAAEAHAACVAAGGLFTNVHGILTCSNPRRPLAGATARQLPSYNPNPAWAQLGRNVPARRTYPNLSSYFSTDDYPAVAYRTQDQGTTGVSLTIGPNGRVSDCSVTASSGSAALDQATCRILRSRARYTPARDSSGNPTTGTDSGRITWTVPAD